MDDFAAAFGDLDDDLDFGIKEAAEAREKRIQTARKAAVRYTPKYEEPGWFTNYGMNATDDRDKPPPKEIEKARDSEVQYLYAKREYDAILKKWPSLFLNDIANVRSKHKKTRKTIALADTDVFSDVDVLDNNQVEWADLLLRSALHTTPPTINDDIIAIARLYKRVSKTNAAFGLPASRVLLIASNNTDPVLLNESLQSLLLSLSHHPNFYLIPQYGILLTQLVPSKENLPEYLTDATRASLQDFLQRTATPSAEEDTAAPVKSVREL